MAKVTDLNVSRVDEDKSADVQSRLLNAATDLFIKKGYRGVSIREIADRAKTNSALISYYFGDKEGLFIQVFKSVAAPLNTKRIANFEILEKSGNLSVESVVRAWVAPMFEGTSLSKESPVAALSLSLNAEQGELSEQVILAIYDVINLRFLALLEQCIPEVSRETLVWRLYFLVGAILTATRPRGRSVKKLTGGVVSSQDSTEFVDQLVQFASAGFRAEAPKKQRLKAGRK
jgi:AcrR family transcriptional regulator